MNEQRQPALFVGHGSPMNVLENNEWTRAIAACPARLEARPRAIVVISAHWQSKGTCITSSAHPEQIYDFYGFPDNLYGYKYAPAGDPALAAEIASAVPGMTADPKRGIDHAGWAVAKHMYPGADMPLLQISLDAQKTPGEHFLLAQKMAALRDRNILFIGSGNVVHNLGDIAFDGRDKPFPWAQKADAWMKEQILALATDRLIDYHKEMPDWRRSIPTNEHFLPLLYVLGMRKADEKPEFIDESIQNGSIAMRSFVLS